MIMKCEVTTECPICKKKFSRMTYIEGVIAGMVLDICPTCEKDMTDEYGNMIIKM